MKYIGINKLSRDMMMDISKGISTCVTF